MSLAVQDSLSNVETFVPAVQKKGFPKGPFVCPICKKVYRSKSGVDYHLNVVGHDENGKELTRNEHARPMNNTPKKAASKARAKRMKKRKSGCLKSSSVPSPAPTKKATLTYGQAQRLVQVDVEGSLYRVPMHEGLNVVVDNEPMECTDNAQNEDIVDVPCADSTLSSLNDDCSNSPETVPEEEKDDAVPQASAAASGEDVHTPHGKATGTPEPCRKVPKRTCAKSKSSTDLVKSTPDVKKKQRRTASKGACTSALPVAVVRLIEPPCTNLTLETKSSYIRFIEKSNEELNDTVEYDMDEDDNEWLDGVNAKRKKDGISPVSRETFELLLDRLEKESFFESRRDGTNGLDPALIDEDAVCCICNDGEVQNSNAILFCDMCNLAVHQECYGVPFIPEGQWLCRRCLNSPSCAVDCVLCPNKGGAFKQTDTSQWAHVVCALWIPEVQFANAVFLEPIDSIGVIPGARWKLTCYICHRRGGACIQCVKSNCYTAFHPTCAQHAGLHMKMEILKKADGDDGKVVQSVRKLVYCDAHSPQSGDDPCEDLSCSLTPVGKSTPRMPPQDLLKKKLQAERRLSALSAAPIVNIPSVPDNKLAEIADLVNIPKKTAFLQRLRSFWALKRQSRSGVPLLRRLQASHQSQKSGLETETVAALKEQLVHWHRLRHDLERSRLLIELIRKREKLKREDLRMQQHMTDLQLQPLTVLLRRTLDQLQQKDALNIFAEPVSVGEVPDYLDIVSQPMDFSSMRRKVEERQYSSVMAFADDFRLLYSNCMLYNAKETVYYRQAIRLRDTGAPLVRFARRQFELASIDPVTLMHLKKNPDSEQLPTLLGGDLTLAEQLEELKVEHEEVRISSSPGKTARLRTLRTQMAGIKKKMNKEIVQKKVEAGVLTAEEGAVEVEPSPSTKLKSQKRRRGGGGRPRKRTLPCEGAAAAASNDTAAYSDTELDDTGGDLSADVNDAEGAYAAASSSNARGDSEGARNGLLDSGIRPQRTRKPSERMRETDDFTLRCATVTRTSSQDVSDLPVSPTSMSPMASGPGHPLQLTSPTDDLTAAMRTQSSSYAEPAVASSGAGCTGSRPSLPIVSLPRIKRSATESSGGDDLLSAEDIGISDAAPSGGGGLENGFNDSGVTPKPHHALPHLFADASSPDSEHVHASNPSTPFIESPSGRKKRRVGRPPNSARNSASGSSAALVLEEHMHRYSNSDARLHASGEAMDVDGADGVAGMVMDDTVNVALKPLDLVWAKCRGYPSYPALIINPDMTEDDANIGGGVYVPLPPSTVLDLRLEDDTNLVLFFDARRTWQWLPRSKLAPLGSHMKTDAAKLLESRKPATRRSVSKAFDRALMYKIRADPLAPAGSVSDEPLLEEESDGMMDL